MALVWLFQLRKSCFRGQPIKPKCTSPWSQSQLQCFQPCEEPIGVCRSLLGQKLPRWEQKGRLRLIASLLFCFLVENVEQLVIMKQGERRSGWRTQFGMKKPKQIYSSLPVHTLLTVHERLNACVLGKRTQSFYIFFLSAFSWWVCVFLITAARTRTSSACVRKRESRACLVRETSPVPIVLLYYIDSFSTLESL
jgi:hypothetical protein